LIPRFPGPNAFESRHLREIVPTNLIPEAICPACQHLGLEHTTEQVDLPFFGASVEILLRCLECGYRHNDFMLTQHREPTRYTYAVAKADDMSVRVVRSGSGTIRIPELGIHIEPGVASEAFISNVEGVFVRVERVLDQLLRDSESPEMTTRINDMVERLGGLRDGKGGPVTLILEDPFGNSAILAEGAKSERIPDDEADQLKTGLLVYDTSEGNVTEKKD
jgi:zinc finger protein